MAEEPTDAAVGSEDFALAGLRAGAAISYGVVQATGEPLSLVFCAHRRNVPGFIVRCRTVMERWPRWQPSPASLQFNETPMGSRILNLSIETHEEHLGVVRALLRDHGRIVALANSDFPECALGVRSGERSVLRDEPVRPHQATRRVMRGLGFRRKSAKETE